MNCKYCAIAPNGDIPDDGTYEHLLDLDFTDEIEDETSFKKKEKDGYLRKFGTIKFEASHDYYAYVGISEGNLLSLNVWDVADDQFDTGIRIKFCPMCGRKLEAFKYDDE